jgi:hypothetical protein
MFKALIMLLHIITSIFNAFYPGPAEQHRLAKRPHGRPETIIAFCFFFHMEFNFCSSSVYAPANSVALIWIC